MSSTGEDFSGFDSEWLDRGTRKRLAIGAMLSVLAAAAFEAGYVDWIVWKRVAGELIVVWAIPLLYAIYGAFVAWNAREFWKRLAALLPWIAGGITLVMIASHFAP